MSDKRRARLIFDKWKADLVKKDRRWSKVAENFDELFFDMYNSDIPFDEAHEYIKDAAAAHSPTMTVAKRTFNSMKSRLGKDFQEFYKDWRESIGSHATSSFFNWFSIDSKKKEDMTFGNMSPQEYAKQREYVKQFPQVDLKKIRAQMKLIEESDVGETEIDIEVDL